MHQRWHALLAVIGLLVLIGSMPFAIPRAAPQEPAQSPTVTVAVHQLTPFVMGTGDDLTGFTIDVWEEIADRLDWQTRYVDVGDVAGQLRAVGDGRADIAAGAISLTSERGLSYDFSQPTLDAGLQIMVPTQTVEPASPSLTAFTKLVFSKTMLGWLIAALLISVLPAHILWLIERRHDTGAVSKHYFPGIFQAFAWGVGSLVGAGAAAPPRQWMARTMAILWAFVSIVFVSFYTANLTATLTLAKLEAQINGPADLYGKSVATVTGTTSASFLRTMGIDATAMASIEECYRALLDGGYDAVVYDAPVLRYFVAHQGDGAALMAGPVFQEDDYGLVFRIGSQLRKPVDQTLLSMREDGSFGMIEEKWFGDDADSTVEG